MLGENTCRFTGCILCPSAYDTSVSWLISRPDPPVSVTSKNPNGFGNPNVFAYSALKLNQGLYKMFLFKEPVLLLKFDDFSASRYVL